MSSGEVRIREATSEDAEGFARVVRLAFNLPQPRFETIRGSFRPDLTLVGDRGGEVVATAQALPLAQWFGGKPVPAAGIAAVATAPLLRGAGVGREVVRRLLVRSRDAGMLLASLYPATVPFYRALGFEFAGTHTTYRIPLSDLPDGETGELTEITDADVDAMRASYRRLAAVENGLTEGLDEDWWTGRVLAGQWDEPRGAIGTGGGIPDAYATYRLQGVPNEWGYRIRCPHLVAHTPDAARALLGHFRRFKGVGRDLEWHGPPTEPLLALLPEQSLGVQSSFAYMGRLLDVPAALEARGYPEVSGSAALTVHDPLFPDNAGTFLVEAHGGRVGVSRAPQGAPQRSAMSIGALSSLFAGYVTPRQAGRVGLVDADDPALPLLGALFAGPPPWTPDFF